MSQQFMFVPSAIPTDTLKQKELRYAAAKAHIARNVHRKQQQKLRRQYQKHPTEVLLPSNAPVLVGHDTDGEHLPAVHERGTSTPWTTLSPNNTITIPALFYGNSDPFACQLVPVTPLVNQAVSFARFHLTRSWSPSFMLRLVSDSTRYCPLLGCYGSLLGLKAARWLWNLLVADVGAFWSAVASAVPLMSTIMSEESGLSMDEIALQLKARSLARIREAMHRTDYISRPSMVFVYHVKALFREACMTGDTEAARSHAKMLRYLTERLPVDEDFQFPRVALWGDAIPALLQFRRPLLDYSEWMPQVLATSWRAAEAALPSSVSDSTQLPNSIRDPYLRAAFLHVRRALDISSVSMIAEDPRQMHQAEVVFHWITSKAEHHICRLLHFYFDLSSPDAVTSRSLTPGERYTTAAVALALLHIFQKSFCDVTQSKGVDLHESAGALRPAMMRMMKLAMQNCSREERETFEEAHFWILFVGTYCEERLRISHSASHNRTNAFVGLVDNTSVGIAYEWFHNELSKQALNMNLVRWSDAKHTLHHFVLNEFLDPRAEDWYEASTILRKRSVPSK